MSGELLFRSSRDAEEIASSRTGSGGTTVGSPTGSGGEGVRTAFPALDVLRMATSEAARVLGIDHLVGSLEPGKRADIIAVRTRSPRLQPWHDLLANLVYATRGSDVTAVFVDGRQLVRRGRPLFLDPEQYVNLPLEATYEGAYAGVPQYYRNILEA